MNMFNRNRYWAILHYITCSPMNTLQWMGAVRMRVQTADKNITIIHKYPNDSSPSGNILFKWKAACFRLFFCNIIGFTALDTIGWKHNFNLIDLNDNTAVIHRAALLLNHHCFKFDEFCHINTCCFTAALNVSCICLSLYHWFLLISCSLLWSCLETICIA